MKINIQSLLKRISPVLCVLLILLSLAVPAIPVQAVDTAIIEAGTYRFNDVLSAPSEIFEIDINFTVVDNLLIEYTTADGDSSYIPVSVVADCTGIICAITPDTGIVVMGFNYTSINGTAVFDSGEVESFVIDTDNFVLLYVENFTGLEVSGYTIQANTFGKTITIPTDSEVSAEFYEWFAVNAVKVTEEEPTYLRIPIYSSSGDLIEAWVGEAPATFTVGDNSLSAEFADYESYGRDYEGDETFVGVRVNGSLYTPGDTFTLTEDADIYFETKKALNVYDHDTGNLLFSANGQLPLWIEIYSKSLVVYYADKSVEYQSFVINKGLQISGISTALTYADPQYTVNQSVRFEDPVDIYVYWTDTPVADPAPSLPETGPELIDPGSGDLWDKIYNDNLDINDYIEQINRLPIANVQKYDFSVENIFGSSFNEVNMLLSSIANEGYMPQVLTSLGLAILIAVILFGSER